MNSMGIVDLGGSLPIPILAVDGSDVPATPDSDPTWKVFDSAGNEILTGTATVNPGSETGFYHAVVACTEGNGFASGNTYTFYAEWAISASARGEKTSFHVQ